MQYLRLHDLKTHKLSESLKMLSLYTTDLTPWQLRLCRDDVARPGGCSRHSAAVIASGVNPLMCGVWWSHNITVFESLLTALGQTAGVAPNSS